MSQPSLFDQLESESIGSEILLSFHGVATENHTINLELYAQSLQGFYKAFTKASKDLLDIGISIEISGEEEGSIVAKLKYAGTIGVSGFFFYGALTSILSFHGLQFEDVKNYAYNTFASAIESIKYSEGDIANFEKLQIDIKDKDKQRYILLLRNTEFRIALDEMTLFLESNGMDEMRIRSGSSSVSISSNERQYFKAQLEDSKTVDNFEDTLRVISIDRGRMWRFSSLQMAKEFNAHIYDDAFYHEMQHYQVEKIFEMCLTATVVKTTITRAGKKKADPPIYTINDIKHTPKEVTLFNWDNQE